MAVPNTLLIAFDQSFTFSFRVIPVNCNPSTNNLHTWLLSFIISSKVIITCREKHSGYKVRYRDTAWVSGITKLHVVVSALAVC